MIAKTFVALLLAIAPAAVAQSLTGRWDASVKVGELDIPFRMDIAQNGSNVTGSFFNGDLKIPSSSGNFENDNLSLTYDFYGSTLQATLKDGVLTGTYKSGSRAQAFTAKRYQAPPTVANAPSIDGIWELHNVASKKGESAWQFIVKQNGGAVQATILRVDGDTGVLSGTYQDGKWVLSHFSGFRPALVDVTLEKDGSLQVIQNRRGEPMKAIRPAQARALGLPGPSDPIKHTGMKDPSQPLAFNFPDLNGKLVSNTDPRFKGKVVLVNVAGSWCPNCHDEAPFLMEMYKRFHSQGLEIVALAFEDADQVKDPARLRAFVKKYGIEYTVLLAGKTDEAKEKLSQAENWDAWPTTFFEGRDGLVHEVHAGFPSLASGDLYREAKEEFAAEVEHLLSENKTAQR